MSLHFFFLQQGQFTNPETPGYVGFANLPNQVHRKSVKKGFEFTLMVVGECVIIVSHAFSCFVLLVIIEKTLRYVFLGHLSLFL